MPVPAGSGSSPTPDGLSYDPVLSRVRLSVRVPPMALSVVVDRSTDQVRWTAVRGAGQLTPSAGGLVVVSDYEFTPDVANYYRVRAYASGGIELGPAINANPYIETDTAGWAAAGGGTISRSTAQAHEGAASLLLTPDGVAASAEARTDLMPATAGRTYRAAAWVRCPVSRALGVAVNWYQANGTFISQSASPTPTVTANTWTLVDYTATAPALTGQARLIVGMAGTPSASHLEYIDEACLVDVGGRIFTGSIVPDIGGVWLKSIARPFLNRQVTVRDFSEVSRPTRGGVFDVVGRSFPVAVTDVRGSRRWTLQLATDAPEDADDLDLLLAGGDILLVHVPQGAGRISAVPGGYVTVGDTRVVTPPTYDLQMRVLELPLVEVAAPGPDVIGATVTWQTVLNAYPTWQAVLDAHPTWQSLMELVGSPTDVVVP